MKAKIYKPAKNAMQSGEKKLQNWVLEYEPTEQKFIDPLMGWTGGAETTQQLKMKFPTKEAAIAYAERNNVNYSVQSPKLRRKVKKSYADNFAYKPQ